MVMLLTSVLLGLAPPQRVPIGSAVYRLRIGVYNNKYNSLYQSGVFSIVLPEPIALSPAGPQYVEFIDPADCSISFSNVVEACASAEFGTSLSPSYPFIGASITGVSGRNIRALFSPLALTIPGTVQLYDRSLPPEFYGSLSFYRAGVPEPTAWALLVAGFGMVGLSIRSGRKKPLRVLQR